MKRIFKYRVPQSRPGFDQDIKMPEGAKVINAGIQDGDFVLWAEVDPSAALVYHQVHLVFTGQTVPEGPGWKYITTLIDGGGFVWHVYVR